VNLKWDDDVKMGFLLEILRIVLILLILGVLFSSLLNSVYAALGFDLNNNEYVWLLWIAILILLFVFYRNKLQFSGWCIYLFSFELQIL